MKRLLQPAVEPLCPRTNGAFFAPSWIVKQDGELHIIHLRACSILLQIFIFCPTEFKSHLDTEQEKCLQNLPLF